MGELEPWRARLDALRPELLRLMVDWSQWQPTAAAPPDWGAVRDGCLRGRPPCRPYGGIREWLAAAASRRAEVVVTVFGTPDWAAAAPAGCERPGTRPRSRPPRADALPAYRAMLRSLLDVAAQEGASVRWLSPWNEPNGPWFLSPQRPACDPGAPSVAPAAYTEIFRAAQAEAGTRTGLVLGELAGYGAPRRDATEVGEFLRALPDGVACAARVAAQHSYIRPAKRFDPVAAARAALDARPCTRGLPLWVTETGAGGAAGVERAAIARGAAACRAYDAALRRWRADPGVAAAFHYTFREDPRFPTGLADARLRGTTRAYDVLLGLRSGGPPAVC